MLEKFKNNEVSWELQNYPLVQETTGELGVLEFNEQFNFLVKRMFFLRNIKDDSSRGFHSHRELKQIIICMSGSFMITLDNGLLKQTIEMNEKNNYLYLDGKVWREMNKFSGNAVMLVLCDREYKYDQVIRNYGDFLVNLGEVNNV